MSIGSGEEWLKPNRAAVIAVPSAIVPAKFVILIDPPHPKPAAIAASKIRKRRYGARVG